MSGSPALSTGNSGGKCVFKTEPGREGLRAPAGNSKEESMKVRSLVTTAVIIAVVGAVIWKCAVSILARSEAANCKRTNPSSLMMSGNAPKRALPLRESA